MTDYPEAVREYENDEWHVHEEPLRGWVKHVNKDKADAAIAALQDQRMQLKADIGTLKDLLEQAEARAESWKEKCLFERLRADAP